MAEVEGYQRVIDGARAVEDNYRPHIDVDTAWPLVALGNVADIVAGQSPPGASYNDAGIGVPFYQGKTEFRDKFLGKPSSWTTDPKRFADEGNILMSVRAPVGPVNLATQRVCIGRGLVAIALGKEVFRNYAFYLLRSLEGKITGNAGATFASISKSDVKKIQIPLPPLETQQAIVADIEAEEAMVAANRELIERFEKKIGNVVARVWGEDEKSAIRSSAAE